VPSLPYTDVNPPVTFSIPVAVRDCKIVPNPATIADIRQYPEKPIEYRSIWF
jgi:hypothetical protein